MASSNWLDPAPVPAGAAGLHPDPLLNQLLHRRGVRSAAEASDFLDARERHAPDASQMPNMAKAVARICLAIETGERIGIFGDYDVDGVTSTAVLALALRSASKRPDLVVSRLPRRDEGYGLNDSATKEFADAGAKLMIAVDCGSNDHARIAVARSVGLDVIVLDHHHIDGCPPADAIVVSAQLDPDGPFTMLSAVGVAFLVVTMLAREGCLVEGPRGESETALLDLVALGTLADVVPLTGANRALVRDGLRWIRKGLRPGLAALLRRAGIAPDAVTSEDIGFKLAPMINAAGRMGDPQIALDALLAPTADAASPLVEELQRLNEERKKETRRVISQAETQISCDPELLRSRVMVLAGREWSAGLLGPVASRLVERHNRPVVLLADDGETCVGSARSVRGFDIAGAFDRVTHLITRHGGHGMAAGLTLPSGSVVDFRAALDEVCAELALPADPAASIQIDADLPSRRLDLETVRAIEAMQPFGSGNPRPVLRMRGLRVAQHDVIGADRSHLRVQLRTPGASIKGIFFGGADRARELVFDREIDVAGTLKIDEWKGRTQLGVEIVDFRPAETAR